MKGLTFSHKTNVCLFVAQLCLTLCSPMKHSPQAPLFMGFSRQECWSGLPFPSPGDLPNPEIEPGSPTLQADSLLSELSGKLLLLLLSRFSHVRLCVSLIWTCTSQVSRDIQFITDTQGCRMLGAPNPVLPLQSHHQGNSRNSQIGNYMPPPRSDIHLLLFSQ